jgi:MarR family 2-MHQ and catechol resistance regulon transcriptional repressor
MYLDIKIYAVANSAARKSARRLPAVPDVSGTHLWLVLFKAYRALERHAYRSIEATEVGLSDFGILEALLHKGPQRVNQIGRRIQLTSGSITTAVDRMEARGLVKRSTDPDDRRASVVDLTPKGKALIVEAFREHQAAMDEAASVLSATERSTLIRLLKKLGISADQRSADSNAEEPKS